MDNDKNVDIDESATAGENTLSEGAPRARNRTVMLTPEITGQVRARLAQDSGAPAHEAKGGFGALDSGTGGFVPVSSRRGSGQSEAGYEPRGRQASAGAGREGHTPAAQALGHSASPGTHDRDTVVWNKPSTLVGFLVSFDLDANGEFFALRSGRMIVTSEAPTGGNYLFIRDESVSPMHAIVRIGESGEIQVLDQLSECGSGVKRYSDGEEIELSGEKCSLEHGDSIRFGRRNFQVCIMPKAK